MKIEGEMDMSKAMFVITHKSIEKIELDDFYYLGVGNNKNNAEFKDSSMDNISEKIHIIANLLDYIGCGRIQITKKLVYAITEGFFVK